MVLETSLLVDLLLSLSIGAIMGIEREIMHQKQEVRDFGGIRTFILIALLGFIIAYLATEILHSTAAFLLGFTAFMLLVIASYILIALKTGRIGMTTEIAATIAFLLSSLLVWDTEQKFNLIAVTLAVIVAALLAIKNHLHTFAKNTQIPEFYAALKLAIISIVILPLLPNKDYTPLNIPGVESLLQSMPSVLALASELSVFNPFRIWLMVVFISGISFIGYVLMKTVGTNKGIGMTSFLGGMVSSTAVTIALAEKSKSSTWNVPLAMGIIIASTVMFGRVLLAVLVINPPLVAPLFIPLCVMVATGIVAIIFLARKPKPKRQERINMKSPFALGPALKFGAVFAVILAIARILHLMFGNAGIYTASLIAGLADVDAITISLATLAGKASLENTTAIIGITLAITANMIVKTAIAYMTGARSLAKIVAFVFAAMIVAGALTALFL